MTYNGTVVNGVVILENGTHLPEGAKVRVEPFPPHYTPHFRSVGDWEDPPGEVEGLLGQVQEQRHHDLSLDR